MQLLGQQLKKEERNREAQCVMGNSLAVASLNYKLYQRKVLSLLLNIERVSASRT